MLKFYIILIAELPAKQLFVCMILSMVDCPISCLPDFCIPCLAREVDFHNQIAGLIGLPINRTAELLDVRFILGVMALLFLGLSSSVGIQIA